MNTGYEYWNTVWILAPDWLGPIPPCSTTHKFTLFTHIPSSAETSSLQRRCVNFFSLKLTFQARKIRILESIFLQNKNWLRVQDFVYKTLPLVRISLLIRTVTKSLRFFSGELLYKSNRKLFFLCLHSLSKNTRGIGRFSTVMQTRDEVDVTPPEDVCSE